MYFRIPCSQCNEGERASSHIESLSELQVLRRVAILEISTLGLCIRRWPELKLQVSIFICIFILQTRWTLNQHFSYLPEYSTPCPQK